MEEQRNYVRFGNFWKPENTYESKVYATMFQVYGAIEKVGFKMKAYTHYMERVDFEEIKAL